VAHSGRKEVFVNIHATDWDVERAPSGIGERLLHIGRGLGGELLGATMFEVEPGYRGPYHLHHGNEELLLVVEGIVTVRTPDGEREAGRGELVLFRRGPDGLHALENHANDPVRFVVFSSMVDPDVTEQPERGMVGVFAGGVPTAGVDAPLEAFFPREAARGYRDPD
jgi:uncharacterized cupin superfamily protein